MRETTASTYRVTSSGVMQPAESTTDKMSTPQLSTIKRFSRKLGIGDAYERIMLKDTSSPMLRASSIAFRHKTRDSSASRSRAIIPIRTKSAPASRIGLIFDVPPISGMRKLPSLPRGDYRPSGFDVVFVSLFRLRARSDPRAVSNLDVLHTSVIQCAGDRPCVVGRELEVDHIRPVSKSAVEKRNLLFQGGLHFGTRCPRTR